MEEKKKFDAAERTHMQMHSTGPNTNSANMFRTHTNMMRRGGRGEGGGYCWWIRTQMRDGNFTPLSVGRRCLKMSKKPHTNAFFDV